jgi:hypothetical protein
MNAAADYNVDFLFCQKICDSCFAKGNDFLLFYQLDFHFVYRKFPRAGVFRCNFAVLCRYGYAHLRPLLCVFPAGFCRLSSILPRNLVFVNFSQNILRIFQKKCKILFAENNLNEKPWDAAPHSLTLLPPRKMRGWK